MEAKYGSLGRAMLAARQKMAQAAKGPARPLFSSLKDGMQQMINALLAQIPPDSLRANVTVQAVQPQDDGWTVSAGLDSDQFDAVILALPTGQSARLLQLASQALTAELAAITYSSSVTLTLGYDKKVRDSLPPGFGFLVPRSEGTRLLAATFVHNKFPHRGPPDRAIIRCFLGGSRDEAVLDLSGEDIASIARTELRKILGLAADPLFTRVYKWRAAMAQYGVGHLERLQRIEALRQKLPGLALAGNGYSGIGVPDCVRSGTEAANQLLT